MSKFSFAMLFVLSLTLIPCVGCGGSGDNSVVEVNPNAVDEGESAVEGVSEEDYDAEMAKEMAEQGN
ncbi:MAG: hypothetical protein ACR2NZ_15435 [Rubripirellula sp.]